VRLLALLVLTSCSFHVGAAGDAGTTGDDGGPLDTPVDVLIDVPDGTSTFGDVDLIPALEEYAGAGSWTVGDVGIDTSLLVSTVVLPAGVTLTAGVQSNGGAVAFLRLHDFKLNAGTTLRVIGTRPLVIISDHDVTIEGAIDIGARLLAPGAGGFAPAKGSGAGANGAHIDPNDDGGGGGGGFGGAGGAGGTGGAAVGGAGGGTYPATILVGGSGGGTIAPNLSCTNVGGGGGGAILIFAKHKLTLSGAIHAGGGGGSAGMLCPSPAMYASAGGGGAGGMIYLQTPDLNGSGVLAANGGGGGGAACATGTIPQPGQDGRPSTTVVAAGGIGSDCGSAGASGAVQGTAPSTIGAAQYNGGGGGGGLGRIVVHAPNLATIASSPTAVVTP